PDCWMAVWIAEACRARARSRSLIDAACLSVINDGPAHPTAASTSVSSAITIAERPVESFPGASPRIVSAKCFTRMPSSPRASHSTPADPVDVGQAITLRRTLPNAWAMIRPYWFSEDRWAAWGLLVAVVSLTLGMVYLTVLLNQWNNAFYSALQDMNL